MCHVFSLVAVLSGINGSSIYNFYIDKNYITNSNNKVLLIRYADVRINNLRVTTVQSKNAHDLSHGQYLLNHYFLIT
jgi:hypothetical protein